MLEVLVDSPVVDRVSVLVWLLLRGAGIDVVRACLSTNPVVAILGRDECGTVFFFAPLSGRTFSFGSGNRDFDVEVVLFTDCDRVGIGISWAASMTQCLICNQIPTPLAIPESGHVRMHR